MTETTVTLRENPEVWRCPSSFRAGRSLGRQTLVEQIEKAVAEFGDQPELCLSIIGEICHGEPAWVARKYLDARPNLAGPDAADDGLADAKVPGED